MLDEALCVGGNDVETHRDRPLNTLCCCLAAVAVGSQAPSYKLTGSTLYAKPSGLRSPAYAYLAACLQPHTR
jgi:hypothetical protein